MLPLPAPLRFFIALKPILEVLLLTREVDLTSLAELARASGFDRFQRVIQGAVNGHVSQGQRGSTRCAQRNDKHLRFMGVRSGKKRRCASNTGDSREFTERR